jgi:hypothetical protein
LRVKLGIEAQPWDGEGRDTVKRITNILFNSSSQHAIYKMKKKEFPDLKIPLQWIVPSIVDFHSPIRGFFFKGMSPLMMAIESDICHRIIMKGIDDNVVILTEGCPRDQTPTTCPQPALPVGGGAYSEDW